MSPCASLLGTVQKGVTSMPAFFRALNKIKPVYDWTYKVVMFICKLLLVADIFDQGCASGSTECFICVSFILELLAGSGKRAKVQFDGIESFGLKRGDFCLALNQ